MKGVKRTKRFRHEKIRELIISRDIKTQESLLEDLNRHNVRVTQATLSRDLREMGVTKTPKGLGKFIYKIAQIEPTATERDLKDKFINFVRDIKIAGNLIILKTPPGEAQGVARVIDIASIGDILGTVAGDDTILLIANTKLSARRVLSLFKDLISQK